MARCKLDRESLDFIIEALDDMIKNYKDKFDEKRGDGTYWTNKQYRKAKRQAFTALSNVCRSYINLGFNEEDDIVELGAILQKRREVEQWPDTVNHHTEKGTLKVA